MVVVRPFVRRRLSVTDVLWLSDRGNILHE